MQAFVNIKAKLMQNVLDFPGIAKVLCKPSSSAIKACLWCHIDGTHCFALRKTIYVQNRRYLPQNQVFWTSKSFETEEKKSKPVNISQEQENRHQEQYDQLPNENQRKNFPSFTTEGFNTASNFHSQQLPFSQPLVSSPANFQPSKTHFLRSETVMNSRID